MSLCVLAMAAEFKDQGVAVNALWPRTTIATAAVKNLLGGEELIRASRKPDIMGDAAYVILTRNSRECTGNFFVDDEVLAQAGITNLDSYSVVPGAKLRPDFFV
jgi:citronellol/citronellal dehydrogenase